MQTIYERCCGMDVHKKIIVACLRIGNKTELKRFDTLTCSVKDLGNWLLENDCQMVAMESTGVYWKPIYNILELLNLDVMVVNAHHMKSVPGRKTDVKDAEWIADLLQHGLLKASYIPDKEQRELRDVVRYRKSLIEERARELNRLEKILEGANIKLSSFVSSLTGVSSRRLIEQAIQGEVNNENIDDLIHHSMQSKKAELLLAMEGALSNVQKLLVSAILDHYDDMSRRIIELDNIIDNQMKKYEDAIQKIDELPGIGKRSAQTILAEIGLDMSRFPSAAHLTSWTGLCPGNNESAGKRKNGKTNKGNRHLKTTLIQCAKSAQKDKDSFFHAQYQRLVVRRGKNRATVAVAHSMLIAIYHMLKENVSFNDLGSDYYAKFNSEKKANYYLRKLEELGVSVSVSYAT
ncbi:IS110 family transposase [Methanobacterium subterraneum]|jgi:transposase|uniref:IS110 family transposase n=1 Tax=Methanobacterium subterraneum TaxID=59277 RepID=A0A7K4DLS0_9EURY|nr:IS110 family transposase [Methanobacterium subterraneum]NMO09279.1 IS110 family transposase [Methanobacterium subterraneum]